MIRNRRGITSLFLAIALILLVGAGIYFSGFNLASVGLQGSGNYVERPIFYYDKCEAVGSYSYSTPITIPASATWTTKPTVTDHYDVQANIALGFGTATNFKYSICNSQFESQANCRIYNQVITIPATFSQVYITTISNVRPTESVLLEAQRCLFGCSSTSGLTYQIGFQPYALREYNVLGGSPNPINPNDCTAISPDSSRIISTDVSKANSKLPTPSSIVNQDVFQPNEVRWYLAGYLASAAPSFVLTYSGQNAWCQPTGTTGQIYKINTVQTSGGTYNIASADWSDSLGSVGCCPGFTNGNQVCNSNFQYTSIQGSNPGPFGSCGSPNWVPYSANTLIKYSRDSNGVCQSQTQNVQCANDYDCKDSNQVCDLNSFKCVNANVNLQGQVIKTVADNTVACQQQGGTWISSSVTNQVGTLCFFGQGLCSSQTTVNQYCSFGNQVNWFGLIILALIVIVIIFTLWRFGGGLFKGLVLLEVLANPITYVILVILIIAFFIIKGMLGF